MAQEQNYQVNYSINVDASQGTKQVIAFGEAVGKLVQAKASLTPAVTNIKNMMDEIDRVFRTKNGKKRNFDYRLTIDTKKSEEKLERIKGLLTDISTLSKGISLTINAGQALDSKKIKANAKSLYEKKAAEMRKAEIEKNAASSVGTMADAQKRITKAIGKINSALVSMERDRELQIKTGTAENRLQQILSPIGSYQKCFCHFFQHAGRHTIRRTHTFRSGAICSAGLRNARKGPAKTDGTALCRTAAASPETGPRGGALYRRPAP